MRIWNPKDDPDKERVQVSEAIPIAGHWGQNSGKGLEWKWTRLKNLDSKEEGLQLELFGKKYGGMMQKAVIHLQCDAKRTGNDGTEKEDDDKRIRDEDDEDDGDEKDNRRDLQFVSYGDVTQDNGVIMKVLRLNWRTKYACEDYKAAPGDASSSWGFFTWFILMWVAPSQALHLS
jgi:autophagy-related protein 27